MRYFPRRIDLLRGGLNGCKPMNGVSNNLIISLGYIKEKQNDKKKWECV